MPPPSESLPPQTFTGRQRRRRTSRAVLLADYVARVFVHLGGYGTIAAVLVMAFFFLSVVLPLFSSGSLNRVEVPPVTWANSRPLALGSDEYQELGWVLLPDGSLEVFDLARGQSVDRFSLSSEERSVTAASFTERGSDFVLGFSDGSIQLAALRFDAEYRARDAFEGRCAALTSGAGMVVEWQRTRIDAEGSPVVATQRSWVEATENDSLRVLTATLALGPSKRMGEAAIARVDHTVKADGGVVVAALIGTATEATAAYVSARATTSMTTGAEELRFGRVLPLTRPPQHASENPFAVRVVGQGLHVLLVHESGLALRYRVEPGQDPRVMEGVDLAPAENERVTALGFLVGGETLLVGSSNGRVSGWFLAPIEPLAAGFEVLQHDGASWLFRAHSAELEAFRQSGQRASFVEREGAALTGAALRAPDEETMAAWLALRTDDGFHLVAAKRYREPGSSPAILGLSSSGRGRIFVAADASSTLRLLHGTSEQEVATWSEGREIVACELGISPKEDALFAWCDGSLQRYAVHAADAGISFATLFRPVWYEGYPAPQHMWQSSAGEDSAEPKLGLWPLVFGTLKATFYSMLFGVPLALLAAIFTSEFLSARAKARVKPTIELMASLPSVVLGFLAALVFAPFVEQHLAGILATFFALPLLLLFSAFCWQLLPRDTAARHTGWRLPLMAVVALPFAIGVGLFVLGPWIDEHMFQGGLRYWLDGARQIPVQGSAFGGWFFFCLPLAGMLVAFGGGRMARSMPVPNSHRTQAVRSLLWFVAGLAVALVVAAAIAALLSTSFDLRGPSSLIDTYDQRNALVVGFVMGFAIVPIIYTIADDALSSVPGHLRGASLGAGATQWQTAVRVVIPTAMSGLFSACMIGLGRAVGETMIVLMAAGSTPVMDINIFNGFRTLSANIATELPEAVQGSAHYRTLFLAALVLFAMTFVLNSIAEAVRQRFRKRAFEL